MINYAKTINAYALKPTKVFDSISQTPFRYAIYHLVLISILIFVPTMWTIVRLEPHVLYERVYAIELEFNGSNEGDTYTLYGDYDNKIEVTDTQVIYSDTMGSFAIDREVVQYLLDDEDYRGIIDYAIMNSGTYGNMLRFTVLTSFLVSTVLYVLFVILIAFAVKVLRINSKKMRYADCFKVVSLTATVPACATSLFGFFLPSIQLIVFPMILTLWVFRFLNECDKLEKEQLENE